MKINCIQCGIKLQMSYNRSILFGMKLVYNFVYMKDLTSVRWFHCSLDMIIATRFMVLLTSSLPY